MGGPGATVALPMRPAGPSGRPNDGTVGPHRQRSRRRGGAGALAPIGTRLKHAGWRRRRGTTRGRGPRRVAWSEQSGGDGWRFGALWLAFLLCLWAGPAAAERVVVLAAASTAHVIDAVIEQFETGSDERVVASYAGTGALARQIESGAPAHIFVAANAAWMDYVEALGLIQPETRQVARRQPPGVRFRRRTASRRSSRLRAARSGGAARRRAARDGQSGPRAGRHLRAPGAGGAGPVVPSVKHAPRACGRRAGGACAGGTRRSAARHRLRDRRRTRSQTFASSPAIPTGLHEPIVYPVARIAGRESSLAARFFAYLTGPEGRAALARAGFIVN